ncbi:uncharacterized protein HGUI_02009 [Hanseniaspora guilliermondii]|uniref:Uncharacterized protein n=1 Tax=Hanseniaspora guilliermondii TaxID=56406 RepID=A0A1L0CN23_9ASCO|nr:uncharacterized protein HGUI_02009 [Hanseniaspora guilliermondii]
MSTIAEDSDYIVTQDYLRNIGIVHIITNGIITKIYNPNDSFSSIGTHANILYDNHKIVQKLHFFVKVDDSLRDLNVSEIRCKSIAGRKTSPDLLEERFIRDPMFTSPLTRQLPCNSLEIRCKNCNHLAIRYNKKDIKRFIDIPESDWEEYMDLWHCHKPTTNKAYNEDVSNIHNLLQHNRKMIKPKADLPILFSDMTLLAYSQPISSKSYFDNDDYVCENCNNRIGKVHLDFDSQGHDYYLEFYKTDILLLFNDNQNNSTIFEVSPMDWLAKEILYYISMYGSRMFKLTPPAGLREQERSLDIWCLDHGISLGINNTKHDHLLKAMYKKHSGQLPGNQNIQEIEIKQGDEDYKCKLYMNLLHEIKNSKKPLSQKISHNYLEEWTPVYI